jgi:hypothetical protein
VSQGPRSRSAARCGAIALAAVAALALALLVAPAGASAAPKTKWLCKAGHTKSPCFDPLTTTVTAADGTTSTERAKPAKSPKVDCFYVYPTVSHQTTTNANLHVDPEEKAIAVWQASRFSQVCRVFVPMYRQVTVQAILGGPGTIPSDAAAKAYADVRNAWREYLRKYNHGRGVVLIGHSQGSLILRQLASDEIDNNRKARRKLVSALLLGGDVVVKKGTGIGGDFKHIPACTSATENGCVVAYSTFGETPPADSLFGRAGDVLAGGDPATDEVLCVDPTELTGDHGALRPYFVTSPFPPPLGAVTGPTPEGPTPWVSFPDLYTAHCAQADGANWLQIDDIGAPGDERPRVQTLLPPTWGLHLVDVNIALGNLVTLVKREAAAYARHHR